ncbi:hypothetical protein GOBAR_DD36758 [Gossypium barbadense]|nr:hypothetical protein GOBAR_DD36758 [Gossypium barbadense]
MPSYNLRTINHDTLTSQEEFEESKRPQVLHPRGVCITRRHSPLPHFQGAPPLGTMGAINLPPRSSRNLRSSQVPSGPLSSSLGTLDCP